MNTWRLHSPGWLLLGLALLALLIWLERRGKPSTMRFSSTTLMDGLPRTWAQRVKPWLPWLRYMGLLLLIIALARPQRGLREFRIQSDGIAIAMCIDRSGSMRAMDFELDGQRVNRLDAVKHVFHNFVEGNDELPGRPADMIALIAFGGFAEARSPLTLDHQAVLDVLDDLNVAEPTLDDFGRPVEPELAEQELATAIGDALALAVDRLRDAPAKSRVVILLSDGENTAGELTPEQGAAAAKALGIKVHSIGVGRSGPAPFPGVDPFGRRGLFTQMVRLDEKTLRMIADATGGHYFHAENTDSLQRIYQEIDQLEKTVSEGRLYSEYQEWYLWAAAPGLLIVIAELVLRTTRFRSAP